MKFNKQHIAFSETGFFTKLSLDYISENKSLANFIEAFPSEAALQRQIELKKAQLINREVLVDSLNSQYSEISIHENVSNNIKRFKDDDTFSITTAHQPNIFTGYLYFIYKIVHAIVLAKECKKLFPSYNFVPVYYMGSEDNDIDEIGTVNFNTKKYQWKPALNGACGRMTLEDLIPILNEILQTLNPQIEDEKWLYETLITSYQPQFTLAKATRIFTNALFGKYGLVIIDGDDKALKSLFKNAILEELISQKAFQNTKETISKLSELYNVQANPREINLFYLNDGIRERIEFIQEEWIVKNTALKFTKEQLIQTLDKHPEYFSPNVITRPLYQETILPNIAFVGGGGELAYWIELKSYFESMQVPFPILFLRNSIQVFDTKSVEIISKINLNAHEVFEPIEKFIQEKLEQDDSYNKFQEQKKNIIEQQNSILTIANQVSNQLEISSKAHLQKIHKILDRLDQKFRAQIKSKQDWELDKITLLKQHLFPQNTLQERHQNFIELYKLYGSSFIENLIELQEPFGKEFILLLTNPEQ
jgi:bacillithiol biosynthesis cysteine-adding enzyme BshC